MPTQKTPGRKIIAFLMVTLDGYHQAADGDLSWHNVDDEFNEFAAAQMDEADTLLFGRKTYEGMAEFWRSPMALAVDASMSERMNRYPKIVVSRSLASPEWAPSTLISNDAPAQLDELRIMVNPVILGTGDAALAGARRSSLELARVRQFTSGNVLLTYYPQR
jgi:dihydrofolate reductase